MADNYDGFEDEEPLIRIVARRAVRKARIEAATPQFGRLLLFQASGAAGDALLALALAGSLFFSVPEADARARVAQYLLLTVAPFAVLAPVLARVLDRSRSSLRIAVVVASLGRGTLAWLLATRLDSLLLFPIAFGVLLLSRAALIVKGAMLPDVVPEGRSLVHANASLSKVTALAGLLAGLPGLALIRWPGPGTELIVCAFVYYLGAIPALRLPRRRHRVDAATRDLARQGVRSVTIRQAIVATATMRLLIGFLIFHLAFALRREDLSSLGLGALIGSAALGSLFGALLAPRLRRRLKEEGILVSSLAIAGLAGLLAGRFFSVGSAAALVFAFGIASGASKVAFDSVVQRDAPPAARGWAFARFESILQLVWVAGALVPLLLAIPAGPGTVIAGVTASLMAILYTWGRGRARTLRLQ